MNTSQLSIDTQQTVAILIGTSEFARDPRNLPPIPSVNNNIVDLANILRNKDIVGIPHSKLFIFLNHTNAGDVVTDVARKAAQAKDTLLLYYAGHGLIGKDRKLLLTFVSSETEHDTTSLEFKQIQDIMSRSIAKKKILILDCCFSGRALGIMGAESALVNANLDIKGTYVFASAPSNQPAVSPEDCSRTAFTDQFLLVLTKGIDNNRKVITMDEIFHTVRGQLVSAGLPEPQQAGYQHGGDIAIAYNKYDTTAIVDGTTIGQPVEEQEADEESKVKPQPTIYERVTTMKSLMVLMSIAIASLTCFTLYLYFRLATIDPSISINTQELVIHKFDVEKNYIVFRKTEGNNSPYASLVINTGSKSPPHVTVWESDDPHVNTLMAQAGTFKNKLGKQFDGIHISFALVDKNTGQPSADTSSLRWVSFCIAQRGAKDSSLWKTEVIDYR